MHESYTSDRLRRAAIVAHVLRFCCKVVIKQFMFRDRMYEGLSSGLTVCKASIIICMLSYTVVYLLTGFRFRSIATAPLFFERSGFKFPSPIYIHSSQFA